VGNRQFAIFVWFQHQIGGGLIGCRMNQACLVLWLPHEPNTTSDLSYFQWVSEKYKRLIIYNFLCTLYFNCIYYKTDLKDTLL
jgi:hypothetical protein